MMMESTTKAERQIDVREVAIKAVQVTVKALRLGPRQMTLATFKQLKKGDLLDPVTGELRGVPWGTINYYWDCCHVRGVEEGRRNHGRHIWTGHLQAVWQEGRQLRRTCLWCHRPVPVLDKERSAQRDKTEATSRHLAAEMLLRVASGDSVPEDVLSALDKDGGEDYWLELVDLPGLIPQNVTVYAYDLNSFGSDTRRRLRQISHPGPYWSESSEQCRKALGQAVVEYASKHSKGNWSADEHRAAAARMIRELVDAKKEIDTRNDTWKKHYEEIAALDQLFIAV